MLPTSWLTLVLFLLLVAPGMLFDLLAAKRRVGAPESAFREISRIALGSLGFSAIGLAVVTVLHLKWGRAFVALDKAVTDKPYLTSQLRHVVVTAVVATVVALLAALALHWWLGRGKDKPHLTHDSLWTKAFREDRPTNTDPHVWVKLSSGPRFIGKVAHYSADLDLTDRELILAPPLYMEMPGQAELIEIGKQGWQRLVIPGNAIEAIGVQYRPTTEPPAAKSASPTEQTS
ncbi:DUF6338 family protein [Kribbella sindirgiensis]|uniref:Uncharacterized protein n=1 Tax=Kribbella sindirgiensis TaxID=1124744 RepID=A0A4R0IZ47_9ACTN|nr:DUF6338 family protein [Kribbella sindirgiensis]TCC39371.1 hypothetical protein E0H50_05400 [Kribbella sindirgiensis]